MKLLTILFVVTLLILITGCGGDSEKGETIVTDLKDSESANLVDHNTGEVLPVQPTLLGKWKTSDGSVRWNFTSSNTVSASFGGPAQTYGYELVGSDKMNILSSPGGSQIFVHAYDLSENALNIYDSTHTQLQFPMIRDD